jgi:S1-C subfamily serine protease
MKQRDVRELEAGEPRTGRQNVSGPVAIIIVVIATIVCVAVFSRSSLAPKETGAFVLPPEPPLGQGEMTASTQGLRPLGIVAVMPPIPSDRLKGVRVAGVIRGSPAEKAGIKPADLIVGFDHQPTRHVPQLVSLIGKVKPEKTYLVEVMRSGKKESLTVKGMMPLPPEERPRP